MDIDIRLKEARIKSELTQEQVAEKINVSRVTVSHWENGKSLPDIMSLLKLSELYDISLDELVKGDSRMKQKIEKDTRNLKSSKKIIFALIIATAVLIAGVIIFVVHLFSEQYNPKGISSLLVIAIDESQPMEYVGVLDNRKVYVEGLKIDGLRLRTIDAQDITLTEAIEKGLISIDDWRKKAWSIKKDEDTEVLQYENYEIAITDDAYIIRPIKKTETS